MVAVAEETAVMPELVVDRSPEMLRGKPGGSLTRLIARVRVTKEDIAEGRRGDGASCAIARALLRQFPECTKVSVAGEAPVIWIKGSRQELHLGREIIEWIGRFDRSEPVEPLVLDFCQ